MKSSLIRYRLVVTAFSLGLGGLVAFGQDPASPPAAPERSAEVMRALKVVEQYVAAEKSSAGERVESRRGILEFSFRTTRENGRYRVLNEQAWREWEMDRSSDREVRRLEMLGEPKVEKIGDNLVRVHCAVHLSVVEDGEPWEGVSLRSFEVRLQDDGAPRIRHERLLANREGIQPGQWKKLRKAESKSGRSNIRSSPSTTRNNIIGKVENGENLHVWDQKDERWLLVRTDGGLLGFIHRSQIDFTAPPVPSEGGKPGAAAEAAQEKKYPFAVILPGKPGYVLNPYTNTIVDVRQLKAGTLVRDPRDPVKDRPFRVPFEGRPVRAVIVDE